MSAGSMMQYPPGDPRMIDTIVHQLKSQGIFDQFRKECIADVDTKPAYQNLHQRVESTVSGFLAHQVWRPDMNKNQLRESLRKHIHESGFLDMGVERIVDQVVNPKINSVLVPQVEDVVYKFIGVEKPKKRLDFLHNPPPPSLFSFHVDAPDKKKDVGLTDLLPRDLDPISPESDETKKSDHSVEDGELDEDKVCDDETSPPFESVAEANDNSVGSHLSGISGLTSPDGRHSSISYVGDKTPPQVMPLESNNDSQLSKVSSGSHLSISFDEPDKPSQGTNEVATMDIDFSGAANSTKDIQVLPLVPFVDSESSKSSDDLPDAVNVERPDSVTFSDDSSCSAPEYETREDYSPLGHSTDEQEDVLMQKVEVFKDADLRKMEEEEHTKIMNEDEGWMKHEKEENKFIRKDKDNNVMSDKNQGEKLLVKTEVEKAVKKDRESIKSFVRDNSVTIKEGENVKKEKKELKIGTEEKERKVTKDVKVRTGEKDEHSKKKDSDSGSLKKIDKEREIKRHESKSKGDKNVKKEEKDKKSMKNDDKEKSGKRDEKDKSDKKEDKEPKPIKRDDKHRSDHGSGSHDSKRKESTSSSHSSHRTKSDKERHQSSSKSRKHDDVEKGSKSEKRDDAEKSSKSEKRDDVEKSSKSEKRDDVEKSSKSEKRDDVEKSSKSEKRDDVEKSSKSEKRDDVEKSSKSDKHVHKDDKIKREEKSKSDDKHKSKNGKLDKEKLSKGDDKTSKDKDRLAKEKDVTPRKSESIKIDKDKRDSKSKSSSDKSKDGKRREKVKTTDDHDKHREKRSEDRRSTDRDSNGTTRGTAPSSSQTTTAGSKVAQRHEAKDDKKEGKSRNGGNADDSGAPRDEEKDKSAPVSTKSSPKKRPLETHEELCEEYFCTNDEGKLTLKIKKPKIAANIFEVQKIIRMRKSLAKMEIRRQKELSAVQDLMEASDQSAIEQPIVEVVMQPTENQLTVELLPDSEYDGTEDLKGFEECSFVDSQNFIDYVKRISESRMLSEIDASSVSSNDLEYLSDSESIEETNDYSKKRLPYPDIGLSPGTIQENKAVNTFNNIVVVPKHHNLKVEADKSIESTPMTVRVEVVSKSQTTSNTMSTTETPLLRADDVAEEMRPPANTVPPSDIRETRRARKPNVRYSSEDYSFELDDEHPEKKATAKRHAVTQPKATPAKKLKVSKSEPANQASELYKDVKVDGRDAVATRERDVDRAGSASPDSDRPESDRPINKLGPSRRVGLTRPKPPVITKVAVLEIARVATPPNPDFVMPLSPESDVSASSGELAKKGATDTSPAKSEEESSQVAGQKEERNQRSGAAVKGQQRYSSDDLYKPRPLFNRLTRRNRGTPPPEEAAAAKCVSQRNILDSKTQTQKQQR